MELPGASKSVRVFLLLKELRLPVLVVDATAVTLLMHAGERMVLVLPELPVDATTLMLLRIAIFTNVASKSESQVLLVSQELVNPPEQPTLMLITLML